MTQNVHNLIAYPQFTSIHPIMNQPKTLFAGSPNHRTRCPHATDYPPTSLSLPHVVPMQHGTHAVCAIMSMRATREQPMIRPSTSTFPPPGTTPPAPLPARILLVDDDPIMLDAMARYLSSPTGGGYQVDTAPDGSEALAMLAGVGRPNRPSTPTNPSDHPPSTTPTHAGYQLVITDVNMPRTDGLELLRAIRQQHPEIVVLICTGYGTIENAVEAIKLGAFDYLTKPVIDDGLKVSIERALRQQMLVSENQDLRRQLDLRFGLENIVGHDHKMLKIFDLVEAVADSKTTILISGESGTGKSLVARALHHRSGRRAKPFIEVSCGAIPESLLESELFGHVKGAFTGATGDKEGRFLAADGGTIFLDEINSASPAFQVKLLRVLQERRFEAVGSSQPTTVDVRVVLASNQELSALVAAGQFRQDLFYRINVVNVQMPALRQRFGDIPLLAQNFLERFAREMNRRVTGFTRAAMDVLQRHPWPGNVRELENAIERAVVLAQRPIITPEDLPASVLEASLPPPTNANGPTATSAPTGTGPAWNGQPLEQALQEPERQILLAALKANRWNRQATAQQLDINRTTLYKKMKAHGLDSPDPAEVGVL